MPKIMLAQWAKPLLVACFLLVHGLSQCRRARQDKTRQQRFWAREIYQKREELGTYHIRSESFDFTIEGSSGKLLDINIAHCCIIIASYCLVKS